MITNEFLPPQIRRDELTVMMALNEISRLFGRAIRSTEKPGSAMSQESFRLILIALSRRDGITQLDLCNITHLKPPTISITLEKMESLGYVNRVRDEKDMRAFRVYLTDLGRREHDERLADIKDLEALATKDLSPDERRTLMNILIKVRKNVYTLNGIEYDEGKDD